MAILKRYEKKSIIRRLFKILYKPNWVEIVILFCVISSILFYSYILLYFFCTTYLKFSDKYLSIILLFTVVIFLIFVLFYRFRNLSKIKKSCDKWGKYVNDKFNENKETLVVVAKDKYKNLNRCFSPTLKKEILYFIAYLNLRWGKGNYSILYTDSPTDIINAIQNQTVKNLYFYGHGDRAHFENYGILFDYDLLRLIDHKKERVFQLTCCEDTGAGCAADYLLEGENKQKYQAGTIIHDVISIDDFFVLIFSFYV